MSAVDFNESSILISAKLDEVKTVNTINSQLKNLKINPIEVEVVASKIPNTGSVPSNSQSSANLSSNNATANLQKQNQQMALLTTNIQKAQAQVQMLATNWSAIKTNPELNAELQRLIASSKQLSTSADLKQFNAELNTFRTRCRSAGVATKSLGDSFKTAWKNFSFFFSASRMIYIVTTRMKELLTNVKDLNSAMIELRKVTDETEGSYDRFLTKAKANSKEVGMGLSEYVNATADFARLGYSVTESNELAKVAAMYKNVADDMDNVETGTSTLISTMKAFNVESEDAISIVDKLNEVSNNYAVTSGNLGEGLANSAASMAVAGNTLDETIALLTSGTEITQDASNMGNTLKIVSMRLRGMKGQLQELGEDVDENVESISKMQTQVLNLTHGKVNIFDDNGNFKSTYDILQGIASVYKDLSSTEQADLLETIAGKNRGNAVAAILTNFSTAQDSLATSLDSAGSAAKENEKYMQGLEGHLQQLQSAWESLSSTLVDDGFLTGVVSVGTGVVSTIDGIASSIGGLQTILAGVGIGIFLKNFKNIKTHVELTSKAFASAQNIVNQYGVSTELSSTAIMQYRTALEGLTEKEQQAILTKIGLNESQRNAILGLNQEATATTALTLSEMQQIASDSQLSSEQMQKIILFTQGQLAIEGEALATNELTIENIKAISTTLNLNKAQQQAIINAIKLKAANESVTKSSKGLGVTLGSFFKSKAGIFSLAITAFTLVSSIINAVQQQQEEAYNKIVEQAEEATSHIQNVEQAWSQYLELGTSATEEEKRKALESVNQQLDNKIQKLQDATVAEQDYAKAVEHSAQLDYSSAAGDAYTAAEEAEQRVQQQWHTDFVRQFGANNGDGSTSAYMLVKDILGDYITTESDNLYSAQFMIGKYASEMDYDDIDQLMSYYDKLVAAKTKIETEATNSGDDTILGSQFYQYLRDLLDNGFNNVRDYTDFMYQFIYNTKMASEGIPATVDEFNNLREAMLSEAGDSESLRDAIENRLVEAFPTLSQKAQEASVKLSDLDFTIDDNRLSEQIKNQTEAISGIAETYQNLAGVVEDYNTNGYLTIDNLETIINAGDEYIDTLFNEEGQLELNKNAYIKLAKAKLEDIRYSQLQSAISSINSLNKDSETTAVDTLADSTHNLTEETLLLCAAKKIEEGVSPDTVYQYIETYSKYSAMIDTVSNSLDTATDETLGFSKANDKAKDSLEAQKKALEDAKEALEEQKDSLEDGLDSLQNLVDLVTEYITKTKELEKESLEKQKETIDELIDKRKEELELLRDEIEANQTLANKQNTVAQNALAYSIAQLDDSGAGKKAQKETGDALSESRGDLQDYLTEQSLDTRINKLEELQETNDEFYDKQIESIDEYLDNERQLYEDACAMIDNDNGELYSNLLRYVNTYTTTSEAEFNHLWSSAKTAIDKYNVSNVSTLQLLSNMQGYIYSLTDQIAVYDSQIATISETIDSIGNNIGGVAGGINANADALSNFTDKYKQLIALLDENDKVVESGKVNTENKNLIVPNLDTGRGLTWSQILGMQSTDPLHPLINPFTPLTKYASGTRSAIGGLAITQENGYEFIPTSVGNGEYTILDRGNPVFNATATRNLYDMANNPKDFISSIVGDTSKVFGGEFVSNTSVVSPTIQINVQGDATQSTVRALRAEADNIIKQATNNVMNIALRNKHLI